jgi:MFS family permease
VTLGARFTGLWRDRQFLTFWSAQTVSEFGDRISELALPLIAVTLLNATPTEVGLLTAAVWLPNIISLFIGSWVDQRPDKRPLMIAADLARTVILLSLPVTYWIGVLSLPQLYAVALLAGTAHVLFNTAYASFFARMVPREGYLEANSKLSATRSLSFMGGPALAGVLVQVLSAPVAIVADAASFIFSAVQIGRLKIEPASPEPSGESLWQRSRSGMRYLMANGYLRASLGCAATVNFFNLIGTALLVLFASRNLGLSAGTIGMALGIGAAGGLLGATFAARIATRFGVGRVIAVSAVVFPAAIAIVALADGPMLLKAAVLGLAELVASFSVMTFDVPLNALLASVTADNMRSRVTGAFLSINYGIRPLGAVVGGLLGDWLGPRDTLLISGLGGVFAVLWLLGSPVLKVKTIEAVQQDVPAA